MTKVSLTKKSYTVDSLFQWDVNQILEIMGLSLPVAPEVHFAHDHMEQAIVRQATMDTAGVVRVEVPDRLLQRPNRINAYVCTNENGVFNTLHKIVIPVIPRARPSDYEGEDEAEVYSLDALGVEIVPLDAQGIAAVEKVLNPDGTWTLRFSIPRGEPGEAGPPGAPVYITDIIESGESGGENVVLFSDGSTLTIKNGKDGGGGPGSGEAGADGKDGGFYMPELTQVDDDTVALGFTYYENSTPVGVIPPKPINLPAGKDGYTPQKGVDYFDGKDGKDGGYYTPVFSNSDANRMGVTLLPSKAGMDAVPMQSVNLPSGEDGGYYKVSLSQSGENGMRVDYTASKADMPIVPSDYIVLPKGDPASVTAENVQSALGYTPARQDDVAGKVDKTGLSLGLYTDGKYYIFVDGTPVGTGFELSGNSGDVFGYVDENNNVVLTGNLPDGDYTIKYELESGKVIEIGNLVLDNNVYYSVISNLSNCTNSNSATQVVGGQSYSATITANSGYQLSSVTVTMGGQSVSVNGGNISIAEVTGDIVITAVAEEKVTEPENLLPKAIFNASEDPVTSDNGYVSGYKISNSSGGLSQVSGCYASGYISVGLNDTVTIKNITLRSDGNSNNIILYSGTNKASKIVGKPGPTGAFDSSVTVSDGAYSFTPSDWTTDTSVAYFRFSCGGITNATIVEKV